MMKYDPVHSSDNLLISEDFLSNLQIKHTIKCILLLRAVAELVSLENEVDVDDGIENIEIEFCVDCILGWEHVTQEVASFELT